MKQLFLIFLCSVSNLILSAQESEYAISFGFVTTPEIVRPLFNNKSIIIGRAEAMPKVDFTDTLFAIIVNVTGEIIRKLPLNLPKHPVRRCNDVAGLPDGGFVISVKLNLCDLVANHNLIQRYDSLGTLIWSKYSYLDHSSSLPEHIEIAPDGNLIGVVNHKVFKMDVNSGDIIWLTDLPDPNPFIYFEIEDFYLIHNSENIIACNRNYIQVYVQEEGASDLFYWIYRNEFFQKAVQIIPDLFHQSFYCYESGNIYRVQPFAQIELIKNLSAKILHLAFRDGQLYLLSQDSTATYLLKSMADNLHADTLASFDKWGWYCPVFLDASKKNQVLVIGKEGNGLKTDLAPWLEYRGHNLWIRQVKGTIDSISRINVFIADIQQTSPLVIKKYYDHLIDEERFSFEGGGFKIKIQNQGPGNLNLIDVLIDFEWGDYGLCQHRKAKRLQFDNFTINAGESGWLDFNNINIDQQIHVPTQLCFWTSAPNEHPDANHEDDVYCHSISVSAEEIKLPAFSITPNPSHDGCWINSLGTQNDGALFDLAGRLIRRISLPEGQHRLFLETESLPAGLYWLHLGNFAQKLVIQHP